MRTTFGALVIGVLTAASLNINAQQEQPAGGTPATGNAEAGKKVYNTIGCWECHGFSAQGGAAGPRIARLPMALAAFNKVVRSPRAEMPPYTAKVLSDEQLADIYAFLKALPQPRDPKDIPLLNAPSPSPPAP